MGNRPVPLFAGSMFLSAALLFWVEPLVGKLLLPRYGGTPAVWNTCLLFYQAALLLGYGYAHGISRTLSARRQAWVHGAVLLLLLLSLPLSLAPADPADLELHPLGSLLRTLSLSVGLPLFALSATAPLLQGWFARLRPGSDPYVLYAVSNGGSFLSLLAFPLLLEPSLTLAGQRGLWSLCAVLFTLLCAACALLFSKTQGFGGEAPGGVKGRSPWRAEGAAPLQWLLLSMAPAGLLYGVTTLITTDVAPVPLLWIAPLALYLLSFMLAFARPDSRIGELLGMVLPLLLLSMLLSSTQNYVFSRDNFSLDSFLEEHLLGFALISYELHRQLALRRPAPERLTSFYWWISVGGVLGGVLNALVAPVVFSAVLEYPMGLLAALALLAAASQGSAPPRPRVIQAGLGLCLALAGLVLWKGVSLLRLEQPLGLLGLAVFLGISARAFSIARGSLALLAGLALVLLQYAPNREGLLLARRDFFGVHRVTHDAKDNLNVYWHGTTVHGKQSQDPALRATPMMYYTVSGPLGQAFAALAPRLGRVGVVGLGVGSAACYALPGQSWTFYEIAPQVQEIAESVEFFSFLKDMRAPYAIVLGDARLSLERAPDASLDFLVLDAFSSDAVPVHLLTREAIELYFRKLKPSGVAVFNISNRYLRLAPVLASHARALGLVGRVQFEMEPFAVAQLGKAPSQWAILARDEAALAGLARDPRWQPLPAPASQHAWTDDYSNLWGVLQR